MHDVAVVLDLDGVIVRSNFIKHAAMCSLFQGVPEHGDAISRYILAHGGVRRDEKIHHILTRLLGLPATPETMADHLARYDLALQGLLMATPLVDGVADFVASGAHRCFVSSSAPDAEVHLQLQRAGLLPHLSGVYGQSTPKAVALGHIGQQHRAGPLVFFGDSQGDLSAARQARVAFVVVVCERDNFAGADVVKLRDFSSRPAVSEAMAQALQQRVG